VFKSVGGSIHRGESLFDVLSVHSVWPQLRNRLQEQEKALDAPVCLLLTIYPWWRENQ